MSLSFHTPHYTLSNLKILYHETWQKSEIVKIATKVATFTKKGRLNYLFNSEFSLITFSLS